MYALICTAECVAKKCGCGNWPHSSATFRAPAANCRTSRKQSMPPGPVARNNRENATAHHFNNSSPNKNVDGQYLTSQHALEHDKTSIFDPFSTRNNNHLQNAPNNNFSSSAQANVPHFAAESSFGAGKYVALFAAISVDIYFLNFGL